MFLSAGWEQMALELKQKFVGDDGLQEYAWALGILHKGVSKSLLESSKSGMTTFRSRKLLMRVVENAAPSSASTAT